MNALWVTAGSGHALSGCHRPVTVRQGPAAHCLTIFRYNRTRCMNIARRDIFKHRQFLKSGEKPQQSGMVIEQFPARPVRTKGTAKQVGSGVIAMVSVPPPADTWSVCIIRDDSGPVGPHQGRVSDQRYGRADSQIWASAFVCHLPFMLHMRRESMPIQKLSRAAFCLCVLIATFLALVPGPVGQIIESGPERHFLAFLVLPALAAFGWPNISHARLWLAFAVFGGLIEIVQLGMDVGRSGRVIDWVIDCAAITVSLVVVAQLRAAFPQLHDPWDCDEQA